MLPDVLDALEAAWHRTDRLFDLLQGGALFERPIRLRHPFVFYLGHLPAFAWNQVGRGALGLGALQDDLDTLFERGIDPLDERAAEAATIPAWPPVEEILAYRDSARGRLREAAGDLAARGRATGDPLCTGPAGPRVLHLVLEHELMHHETFLYALQRLDPGKKRAPRDLAPHLLGAAPPPEVVAVPGGEVTLGAELDELPFAWDNEVPRRRTRVGDFALDRWPVTVGQFRELVEAGGYDDPRWWGEDDHTWLQGRRAPLAWRRGEDGAWLHRTTFGELPLELVEGWPAIVSHAEAAAYARFRGARLPSEEELLRAAHGDPDGGSERPHPWGDAPPSRERGNFDLARFDPTAVGSFPAGRSAFGVDELVGNGWEWTDTEFGPHPGFRAWARTYPGYSADFFDGEHAVLLGASWATDARLVRRSFRNWFQRRYPYVFAKFRLAR